MSLTRYRQKRDFSRTSEPRGKARTPPGLSYVIQKHDARRLHYDFRLELDGVLLSWAVPKGPSLDPGIKRLAVQTEDHPVEYGSFEGVIPEGEYGGGPVQVWDCGHWVPEGDPRESYQRGRLNFQLEGKKLHGGWHLVRTRRTGKVQNWLLIKSGDAEARSGEAAEITTELTESALSGRPIEEIAQAPDRVWHSKAQPTAKPARTSRGRAPSGPDPSSSEGARKAPLPDFIPPELATLVSAAPEGDAWLHEIKLDGRTGHSKATVWPRQLSDIG
jgi:bifunctional non-homologous end joining protein LigD